MEQNPIGDYEIISCLYTKMFETNLHKKLLGNKVHQIWSRYLDFINSFPVALREKCPNTELFLVRIFQYSVRIQENTNHK